MTATVPNAPRRREPFQRAIDIRDAAVAVAIREGYSHTTCSAVAREAGVSTGLVLHYYNANSLRAAVIAYAIEHKILQIIGEASIHRCPHVLICSPELRQDAMNWIAENH